MEMFAFGHVMPAAVVHLDVDLLMYNLLLLPPEPSQGPRAHVQVQRKPIPLVLLQVLLLINGLFPEAGLLFPEMGLLLSV